MTFFFFCVWLTSHKYIGVKIYENQQILCETVGVVNSQDVSG